MNVLPVVFTGHVDHGKSTLVSRLLLDTGSFPDGKFAELEGAAQRRGVPLEISFLLDSFQVERDQAVTIDATRIWFSSATRRYAVIDAPGHREFVRHMFSGAADARAAVVVVDAAEGPGEQTRRHALLLPLAGVTRAIVAINKMDAVNFSAARYAAIVAGLRDLFARTGLQLIAAVPTVARDGDNVVHPSSRMPWYDGPPLLGALETLDGAEAQTGPVRFAVHDVYRRDEERILVGNLGAGRIAPGATLTFAPSRDRARVARIVRFPASDAPALAGEAVGITLDHPIFVGPGDVASEIATPPQIADVVSATMFWLDRAPLVAGELLRLRCGTRDVTVVLDAIEGVTDIETFEDRPADRLRRNDIARVTLRGLAPLVCDVHPAPLARFALYRGDAVGGGGIVRSVVRHCATATDGGAAAFTAIGAAQRARRYGHRGLVVWLTGAGSDVVSLARHAEALLFSGGAVTFTLDTRSDGANLAERAATLAAAGCIVLVAAAAGSEIAAARGCLPHAFLDVRVGASDPAADVVVGGDNAAAASELAAAVRDAARV